MSAEDKIDKLEELVKDYLKGDSLQSLENYLHDSNILNEQLPKDPLRIAETLEAYLTEDSLNILERGSLTELLEDGLLSILDFSIPT